MDNCNKCSNNTIYKDGLCKKCHKSKLKNKDYVTHKEKRLETGKIWRQNNIEHVKQRDNIYYKNHKSEHNERSKEYYILNRDKIREQRKKYREENPEKIKEQRAKHISNPLVRIRENLRKRVKTYLKTGKRYYELLGCTLYFVKLWYSFAFDLIDKNMTFENYGSYWEIDHVKPVSSFDHSNEEEIKKCYNWSNTSPLICSENRKKNKFFTEEMIIQHNERIQKFLTYCKEKNISQTDLGTADSTTQSQQKV